MAVVAPFNYERYTVIVSPLMMPIEPSVISDSQARVKEVPTSKRANFDLKDKQTFKSKTAQSQISLTMEGPGTSTQAVLTSSGPPSLLNASGFLPSLLGDKDTGTAPAVAASLYRSLNSLVRGTIDVLG